MTIPQIIVLGFLTVLILGGTLLMLPIASASGEWTSFWDAFFTATSAMCVTGQITLNTAAHWSYFGKTVIITLIEIGGMGFMTIIVLLFLLLGKRLNIRQQKVVQESLNLDDLSEPKTVVSYVIRFSLTVQLLGALLLSFDFVPRLGWLKGIYYSVFHSISAFCNAGFDLFGDSMIGFQENPYVLIIIMSLILIGGFGFIVWRDLLTYRKNKRLILHTEIVVRSTIIVIIVSFVLFWIAETKNGTFAHLKPFDQIVNTMFLVITPRTAGYSNIDYRSISVAGVFLTFVLMFIGGSSGSTAGGFKITSFAVLCIYLVSLFKGEEANYRKRSIGRERIQKVLLLMVIGIMLITIISFLLMLTQTLPPGFGMDSVLMEVFSCFGTVGLSMGLTAYLNWFGKFLLIILMFMGRVGILTVILSFGKHDKEKKIHYPEGSILVG